MAGPFRSLIKIPNPPRLSAEERQAYAAPFPDARYKAGVRRFPELVPEHPEIVGSLGAAILAGKSK